MTLEVLDNLVLIGQLKHEPPDQHEFESLLNAAQRSLADASVVGLSEDGQFSLAYGAAHAAALAALRWHGYRSDKRYLVFQCLQHTVGLEAKKWRVLDMCHARRNLAEYEGALDVTAQLIKELIAITTEVVARVTALGPVNAG